MARSPDHKQPQSAELSSLRFVDDLIRQRASEPDNPPLVAFPASDSGLTDFEMFTAQDLDRYVEAVGMDLIDRGIEPAVSGQLKRPSHSRLTFKKTEDVPAVIGLLGAIDLSYFVTMHSMSRLGYSILMLSTRLSTEAYVSLLEKTNCNLVLHSPAHAAILTDVISHRPISAVEIHSRPQLDALKRSRRRMPTFQISSSSASSRIAFILHSSGSTGLPKPVFQTHSAMISGMATGYGGRALNTLPLFHLHGLGMMQRTMFKGGATFFPNPRLPLTVSGVCSILEAVKPNALFAVPYTLKLIAERPQGIETLSRCEVVTAAGSACPDELGHFLTENGVHLVSVCGTYVMYQDAYSTSSEANSATQFRNRPCDDIKSSQG